MPVCKFFLQGSCRYGDKCRYEHPGAGGRSQNSFSALANQTNDNFRGSNQRGRGRGRGSDTFGNHQVRFDNVRGGASGFQGGGSGKNYYQGGNEDVGFGRGRGRGQSNFDQGRQPPGAPRGRGARGGFQGRGRDRQNNSVNPNDAFGITLAELEDDMTRSRPLWVCSCYGPGRDAPTQLIAGSDLEISPEELRVDHYLKMANGQSADETANIERMLSEEMSNRIHAISSDPHGAMQYVANGLNERPNRLDILRDVNPRPDEVRWSQFTREKQRRKQGVFADQKTMLNPGFEGDRNYQAGFGSVSARRFGQPQNSASINSGSQQQPFGSAGNTFGANSFGDNSFNQSQPTHGLFSRDNSVPMNGGGFTQPTNSGPFGRPITPVGQSRPITQDDTMLSPVQPTQSNAFGQNGPRGFFSQPPQSNPSFGQTQQLPNTFAQPQPQPQPGFAPQQPNNVGGGGFAGQPLQLQPSTGNIFAQPTNNLHTLNQEGTTPQQPLQGPQAELKHPYNYMNQHGHFENGIMPETAPEADWIG